MQKKPTRLINQNLWSTILVNFFYVIPCFFLFIAKKQFLRNTRVCCNILMTLFIIDVINVIKKNIGYMCHRVNLPDKVYRYTLYALVILNELM